MYLNHTNEWIYEQKNVFDNHLHYSCVTADVKKIIYIGGIVRSLVGIMQWLHAYLQLHTCSSKK
jgi:hypothetical protein